MKNKKTGMIIAIVLVVVVGLIVWGRANQSANATTWMDTNIECLPFGHQSLALHIHPNVTVTVDGERAEVPANIGVTSTCMAEVHTHDASGQIHIESTSRSRTFVLNDFFEVWGEPLEREGYDVQVRVGGELVEEDIREIQLRDLQNIEVIYTSLQDAEEEFSTSTEGEAL